MNMLCQPCQNVKGTVSAAIRADAADGAASGIQQLEKPVSGSCENLLMDAKTPLLEKLNGWSADVRAWIASEPSHPYRNDVPVTNQTTFGRLKAQICLHSCCCSTSTNVFNEQCSLHGEQIALPDVLWEIISAVHVVFNDNFMAFSNTLMDATSRG